MTSRAWTTGETKVLRLFAPLGVNAVALVLERSVKSVKGKATELGVSLDITHEDIETTGVAGRVLDRVSESIGLTLCPMCASRLAIMRTTGTCRVCHLDLLIETREAQLLELARERRLNLLRQEKRRLKVCDDCGRSFFPPVGSAATTCRDCLK